jgi:hypothetical protein
MDWGPNTARQGIDKEEEEEEDLNLKFIVQLC